MRESASDRPLSEGHLDRALREAFARPSGLRPDVQLHDTSLPPESVCRVEAEIARGGMGIVFRARDPALQREVALKLLHEELSGDAAAVERFLEEARVGGMLQHPGVVPVYACGRTQTGRPWFTMKLIAGETLASLLAKRASPAHEQGRFLAILESVCRTIAYAHSRGVVHLDLKPGNVMVGAFGEVQVVDWGLAALLPELEDALGHGRRPGEVFGTPAYMPPEQARGDRALIDGRADLFALGAILCEIFTGSPPYPGGRAAVRQAAAEARLDEARTRLSSAGPAELARLCVRCLNEQPSARPRDATEIADGIAGSFAQLEARARGAEIAAAREGERARQERRARRLTVAFAATVLAVVLGGAALWTKWSMREDARRESVDSRAGEALGEAARLLGQAESSGDPGMYAQAVAATDRAQAMISTGEGSVATRERVSSLRERARAEESQARLEAQRARANAALLRRLEDLRTPGSEDAYPEDPLAREAGYAAAFAEAGLDPDRADAELLAAELLSRGIAIEVASHLDEWTLLRLDACLPGAERLQRLTQLLDPDPGRSAVRAAIASGSLEELGRVAGGPDLSRCREGTLHAFVRALPPSGLGHSEPALHAFRAAHRVRPDDYPVTIELARYAFNCGVEHVAEGEQFYRLAQALRPEHATAFLELGWELEHNDIDYAAAAELERRAVELQPAAGVAYFCLGRALRGLGDLDGALAAQAAAAHMMPGDRRPQKETAMLHRMTGALDRSIQEFASLLAHHPEYYLARSEYASALFDAGRTEEALAQMAQVIAGDERGRSQWEGVEGRMLLQSGSCVQAARILRGLQSDQEVSVLPLFAQGIRLQDYFDLDVLLARCQANAARAPANAEMQCQLAALLDASGRYAAALVAFRAGHALGMAQQAWRSPSSNWILVAEKRAALETRLVTLLAAHESPAAADDGLALARMASRKGLHGPAARWFAELFEREPARAAEPDARLEAACAAVCFSEQLPKTAQESARWRALAHSWLRDELERRGAEVRAGVATLEVSCALGAWEVARELAVVREADGLASLPATERAEWLASWSCASALCSEAQGRSLNSTHPR